MSSSSDSLPISPARFAEAIRDLPISALHLKVLELRNSIAHLDYSNEQLRPFAEGREKPLGPSSSSPSSTSTATTIQAQADTEPDQDCIDAIAENEQVIARMEERILLIRVEVEEKRGRSWAEFRSAEELESEAQQALAEVRVEEAANGTDGNNVTTATNGQTQEQSQGGNPWADGTFQTGVATGGQIVMDQLARNDGAEESSSSSARQPSARFIDDEELRRRMEEQMRGLSDNDDNDGGMHL
ncbi:hypothetical protein MKZ38_003646 [Zalerion maritima]|uniref:Uncharacterized protein n=1 Tax=Zalerion maritima TaxID=339359 RepID=A0AAD5RMI0_9PEZI|nr:hypothetical protein MKZ38_003646 [Zalerion maritima]